MLLKKTNKTKWHTISVLLCFIFNTNLNGQTNLVPNSSFENLSYCTFPFRIEICPPWKNPTASNSSGDLSGVFNSCNTYACCSAPSNIFGTGYQYARTGNGYASAFFLNNIGLNMRNYAQVALKDSLKAGHYYYAEFYVNLVNRSAYACNNVGLYISKTAPTFNSGQVIAVNPQIISYDNVIITDTLNWIKISGIYKSQGGEQYITIGNFKTDAQTDSLITHNPSSLDCAQYNFDDVAVYSLDSFCLQADAGRDTTIKINDSVYIGSYTNGIDTIKWYNAAGQVIDSVQPGFWVKPTATGTTMYIVEQTVNGCTSRDTVYINVVLPLKIIGFSVAFKPPLTPPQEGNVLLQWQTASEVNVHHFNIQRSTNSKDFTTIGTVKAKNKSFNEYTFTDEKLPNTTDQLTLYYQIQAIDNDGKTSYSVIRNVELEIRNEKGISVFPNPAKDVLHIAVKNSRLIGAKATIINAYGIAVKTFILKNGLQNIDVSNLAKGVYYLKTNDIIEKVGIE